MYRVIKRSYRAGRVQKRGFSFACKLLLGSSAFMRIHMILIHHLHTCQCNKCFGNPYYAHANVENPKTENNKYGHVP